MSAIPAVPMPLGVGDVWRACARGPEARAAFEKACVEYHGARRAYAVTSGRLALWMALKALARRWPNRKRVLLPAYTCPTVGRAVLEAGLDGLCVDVSPDDLNLDAAGVAGVLDDGVLAVVAPHMFGTPCDIDTLAAGCRDAGAVLVEDVAQACGARVDDRLVGTFGDLAFLSLGRSKNLRGAGGGVLLVNNQELEDVVADEVNSLRDGRWLSLGGVTKQTAISVLSKPSLWNVAKRLPFLHVGAEDQGFDDEPGRLPAWQAALGLRALGCVDEWNGVRRTLGEIMERELAEVPGLAVQKKPGRKEGTYTRLALRIDGDAEKRDGMVGRLQAQGIDARAFYTRAMYQYDWWAPDPHQSRCPEAEATIDRNLILPVYCAMTQTVARRTGVAARNVLGAAACV